MSLDRLAVFMLRQLAAGYRLVSTAQIQYENYIGPHLPFDKTENEHIS